MFLPHFSGEAALCIWIELQRITAWVLQPLLFAHTKRTPLTLSPRFGEAILSLPATSLCSLSSSSRFYFICQHVLGFLKASSVSLGSNMEGRG